MNSIQFINLLFVPFKQTETQGKFFKFDAA